jgi:tetratricopeptide (TPR) repeat protein
MKRLILCALISPFLMNTVHGATLRVGISAELIGYGIKTPIFGSEFLIKESDNKEIFTGPYTIVLTFNQTNPEIYNFSTDLYGLGPKYNIINHDFSVRPGEAAALPTAPVKEGVNVAYKISLLDDTSKVGPVEFPLEDTSLWSVSETVHYRTHCIIGSLMDFRWNEVMQYLELIYNKYRKSYELSEFSKIDMYIYPEPTEQAYLDSVNFFSIKPRSNRIDLVYGHEIKAATPVPGCELLMYRLWGYGPRWMVTGLAHYYDDNMLRIRDLIKDFDVPAIVELLKDEDRVESDTGSVIAGALVFWLLQNESFGEFKNLYIRSTVLDFEDSFQATYKYPFDEMLNRFMDHVNGYSPSNGELDYYASLYFDHGNMTRAKRYYRELSERNSADRNKDLRKLATCYFWLGNYSAADSVYDVLLEQGDSPPEVSFMKGEVKLAQGKIDSALAYYSRSYKKGFNTGRLKRASILADMGYVDSAAYLLDNIKNEAERYLDYSLDIAQIRIMQGEKADSLLHAVIQKALNSSNSNPGDPRPYFILGRAYAFLGDYEESLHQLNNSYFLETSPFNQATVLLEMGKVEDLSGDRDQAEKSYRQVVALNGGEYQKMMAEKYLKSPYMKKH